MFRQQARQASLQLSQHHLAVWPCGQNDVNVVRADISGMQSPSSSGTHLHDPSIDYLTLFIAEEHWFVGHLFPRGFLQLVVHRNEPRPEMRTPRVAMKPGTVCGPGEPGTVCGPGEEMGDWGEVSHDRGQSWLSGPQAEEEVSQADA